MVTITHTFEVEVTFEGSTDDGAEATSIRFCTGRDWRTKQWLYSQPMELAGDLANAIEVTFQDEAMELIRDAEMDAAEARRDAEEQKADDRWSERGMCDDH